MSKQILLFFFIALGGRVAGAHEIKGQINLQSGSLPPFLFLYSYAFPAQADTIPVGTYGDFKINFLSSSPAAYVLRSGQSIFNFFLNPGEKNITITLFVSDGNVLNGKVENSNEYMAFNDLTKLTDAYDRELFNAIRMNQPDTSLSTFLSYYNMELT